MTGMVSLIESNSSLNDIPLADEQLISVDNRALGEECGCQKYNHVLCVCVCVCVGGWVWVFACVYTVCVCVCAYYYIIIIDNLVFFVSVFVSVFLYCFEFLCFQRRVTYLMCMMLFMVVVSTGTTSAWLFAFLTMTCQPSTESSLVILRHAYVRGFPSGFNEALMSIDMDHPAGGC